LLLEADSSELLVDCYLTRLVLECAIGSPIDNSRSMGWAIMTVGSNWVIEASEGSNWMIEVFVRGSVVLVVSSSLSLRLPGLKPWAKSGMISWNWCRGVSNTWYT
jgi:hypothetical protein